ncbi:unnamed protein product, partial [Rodentolepis nana]|uniref:FACT complex subunit n=1 Tax=Rodentolepis nana TaxID=102285 RepID=A0A0R3TH44_RODNA
MQETAMVFCKKGITILSSKKKVEFLQALKNADSDIRFNFITKSQEDKDKENISTLCKEFLASGNGKILGVFTKELDRNSETVFSKSVLTAFKSKATELVDSSTFFSQIFGVKGTKEIQLMKKACEATCILFSKHLKEKIMDVIDEDR